MASLHKPNPGAFCSSSTEKNTPGAANMTDRVLVVPSVNKTIMWSHPGVQPWISRGKDYNATTMQFHWWMDARKKCQYWMRCGAMLGVWATTCHNLSRPDQKIKTLSLQERWGQEIRGYLKISDQILFFPSQDFKIRTCKCPPEIKKKI